MSERIGINELAKAISDRHMVTRQESGEIVREIFEMIRQAMIQGKSVHLQNFGIFRTIVKPAGMVMDPRTGKKIYRDERKVPKMKYSDNVLKESGKIQPGTNAYERASIGAI